jgi:hypothetical protein
MTNINNKSRFKQCIEYHCFDVAINKKNPKVNHQETIKDEDSDETPKLTFSQMEGECYCCGKGGHESPQFRQ